MIDSVLPPNELELSVIAPCFNEELNVPELTDRCIRTFEAGNLRAELILVDDGSSDTTADVIRAQMERYPDRVVGQFHGTNRGIAQGWRTGVQAARGRAVAIIDSDLQYQPEDLLRLYTTLMDRSVDVVQGWRSPVGRERGGRYWVSRAFNVMLNATFGMDLRDNKSGFVCCSREVMEDLLTYEGFYYYWQSFIMVAAHAKGYSYREVETLFESRKQGESFLDGNTARASARSFLDISRAAVEYRLKSPTKDLVEQALRRYTIEAPPPPSKSAHPLRWTGLMTTFNQTHSLITRNVERQYENLNKTQWMTMTQLRELQDEKLRRLVRHAYRNVPFYRRRMRELKLRPEDIRSQDDLHKLPYLTKEELRQNLYFDIMSETSRHSDMKRIMTSGSTGEPTVCYADRWQLEFRWAAALRAQEWAGYRFGDPTLRLTSSLDQPSRGEQVEEWFANTSRVPLLGMTDEKLASILRVIDGQKPLFVDADAEALDFIAKYIEASQSAPSASLKALLSSAQTLPAPSRQRIEKAFGCPVFDKYGSREFSGVAYECDAHAGHHVVAEGFIVEILVDGRPAKPGETGEVVITDLANFCMPFIRYRIGDLATAQSLEPCACGRGAPRIGEIQGRVQSIIQGTDGRYVPGTFFSYSLAEYSYAIRHFHVVQETPGAIRFHMVKGGRYSDDVLETVKGLIRRHLGDDLRIDVEFTDDIERLGPSSRLASVSKLPVDFQSNAPKAAS